MNGKAHVLIGCSITPASALGNGLTLRECVVLTAISAGFSLGPDIDHPNSTISRSLGKPVHLFFNGLSTSARTILSTGHDRQAAARARFLGRDPSHRSLTHTLLAAVAMGGFAYVMAQSMITTALLAALSVFVCRRLVPGRWQTVFLGAAAATVLAVIAMPLDPSHVAIAATGGWLSHIVADACTTAGVPIFWPLKIHKRRWWKLRLLRGWLKSGDPKEYVAALGVAAVMNLPYFLTV